MDMTPSSCATCGWRGASAGAFCPSCGAQLQSAVAPPTPPAADEPPHTGRRIALLALAGALLIVFLTLFVVGLAIGARADASADPAPTLAPDFPSATALLTLAPQTLTPGTTPTPRETRGGGGSGGRPTKTPTPLDTATPIPPPPTNTPILPTPTPTISSGGG
jgi:hypothetical protein